MDSYKNYDTVRTPTTVLKLGKKESALLRPYFQAELDRAMATYEKKYKYKIQGPVQLEVYPDHPDFEVRTMGMPGLGALGVTFDSVVAMDSPNSRKPGTFHWDSTLWHELSHVYVLNMTHSRVPRWFTEGLAVLRRNRRVARLGRSSGPRRHRSHPHQKASLDLRHRPRLHSPAVSGPSHRLVLPGRQDLQFYRRRNGATTN